VIVEDWTPVAGDWTASDKYWPAGVCCEHSFSWKQQACHMGCDVSCLLQARMGRYCVVVRLDGLGRQRATMRWIVCGASS
jgi:hypothetical protein